MRHYPEYKESGLEWIGKIPGHWKVNRLKYVAKILPSNVDKHIYPDEIQVRLCNYTDVYYNDYITVDTVLEKGSCKESEFTKFVLRKGDVIITKDSETPDDIGVPTFVKNDLDNVVCGYHLTMIRPLVCRGEFVFRFIQSNRTRRYFELHSNGVTRYGLGKPSIENLLLPIPTDSEQRQIANFLDRKTGQIDELIRIKERQTELLQEQRTALINQVVTKGLGPNVEMKPSGVEWIGKIPSHWEIKRLGHVSTIIKGGTPKRNVDRYFQGDLPWARPVDITALQGALYIHDTEIHISEEALNNSAARRLPSGTVLLTSRATIGEIAITTIPMATNQGFANFVCNEQLHNIYLAYYLKAIKDLLISFGSGSTYLEVTKGTLVGVGIPLPPLSEQKQIANFLDHKTKQIDELIVAEQRKIELLKEYRQSLISEAVTGKIDVRNEV